MTGEKQYNRVANWQLKNKILKKLNCIYNSPTLLMVIEMFFDQKLNRKSQIVLLDCYEPYLCGIKNHLYPYLQKV